MKKKLAVAGSLILVIALIKLPGFLIDTYHERQQAQASYELEYVDELDSSIFRAVGYDEDHNMMIVEFLEDGTTYAYFDVPFTEYENMVLSPSASAFYNVYIKDRYESKKIE